MVVEYEITILTGGIKETRTWLLLKSGDEEEMKLRSLWVHLIVCMSHGIEIRRAV